MSTEPRIYTENCIDAYTIITPSSGLTTKNRIFDRDRDVQWASVGSSDGVPAAVLCQFMTPTGQQTGRAIDSIIVLNHNLSDILIQSSPDNVTYTTRASISATGNDLITIANLSAIFWNIRCSNTIIANQEKSIGELIYAALIVAPGVELDSYDVNYRQMAPEIPLADGSIHRTVVKWTESRSAKYEFSGRMSFLTFAQMESLRVLKESGRAFYWQPESVTRPQEIYYVNWTGPFNFRYVSTYKGAGFQVSFQFKEV